MSKELIAQLRVFAGDPALGGVADEAADTITTALGEGK